MPSKEYPRGLPLTELRIYQPGVGKHPNERKAAWVGKIVTVRWLKPIFTVCDCLWEPNIGWEYLYRCEWFGWVAELDAHIPESDLHTLVEKRK